MKHFVQYHNTEAMGYPCAEIERFEILTNKSVLGLLHNTIWLIAGEGTKPRRYYLSYRFSVDETGFSTTPDFRYYARGSAGTFFRPPIRLNDLPWWPEFLRSQNNFSLGLREIRPDYSRDLDEIALMDRLPYLLPDESERSGDLNPISAPYEPEERDTRERIALSIRVRRGGQGFRTDLRNRYGDVCLISGCELLDLLEAAHIKPYRGENDNHVENGLLLRADLHTLFDLDLIGIEPKSLIVRVHPRAQVAGYEHFDGVKLRCIDGAKPSEKALGDRWWRFKEKLTS